MALGCPARHTHRHSQVPSGALLRVCLLQSPWERWPPWIAAAVQSAVFWQGGLWATQLEESWEIRVLA